MHFSDAIVSGWSQFESIPGGMVSSICHSTISFAEDQLTSNLRYELQYLAIYWFCIFICLVIRFPKISEHSLTLSISAILQNYWQNHYFKQKKYFALSMETSLFEIFHGTESINIIQIWSEFIILNIQHILNGIEFSMRFERLSFNWSLIGFYFGSLVFTGIFLMGSCNE